MTGPFPLLTAALDTAIAPVAFFFRDDDAGWADAALFALCDRIATRAPLDLAVIPLAIDDGVASALMDHAGHLSFHQHGYVHWNHQTTGKKCEFSDERPLGQIHQELRLGQDRLRTLFGNRLDPIFTPPWNRCGSTAAKLMVDLGIRTLSRDRGEAPFDLPGLVELPVDVDWTRRRLNLDTALSDAIGRQPVGIMLHHEVLEENDLVLLDQLLDLLTSHHNTRLAHMADLAREMDSQ